MLVTSTLILFDSYANDGKTYAYYFLHCKNGAKKDFFNPEIAFMLPLCSQTIWADQHGLCCLLFTNDYSNHLHLESN